MAYKGSASVIKASKLLCYSIVKASGGAAAVANSLNWKRQYVHKCMNLGYFPLVQVHDVSKLLKVPVWALSYFKLIEVFGEDSPKLESIIKGINLIPAEKQRILKILKHGRKDS